MEQIERTLNEVKKENTRLDKEQGKLINIVTQQSQQIARLEREIARLKANIDSIVANIRSGR
jgi:predicted  nucleic acid-binding Zn-ribbon protein